MGTTISPERLIVSCAVNLVLRECQVSVINFWRSLAGQQLLITPTVMICIQQLGRVEEMFWLPYDAIRNI